MTKVSVIVPVYNPGRDIDDLLESLLGQTLPREELELIFVDDGSTDATPARLDELAARHGHVKVQHIPNSGWPGKPRNIGLDMASGDYVFFADNDDWLERDALERLHATAVEDRADIVIGKVVGHGRNVPRGIFAANRHGIAFEPGLLALLAPHKLFRRGLLDEHGLRFPEGRRRLEDHPLVVAAYLVAERISVIADRPVYHWVSREDKSNASAGRFDAQGYFDNVREVLDLVESRTEPGPLRDELLLHWYRGKMLKRVGGRSWLWRDADYRRELYEAVRPLALERFGEEAHDRLPFNLRLRSKLLRRGDFDALGRMSRYERRLKPVVRIRQIVRGGTHLVLRLDSWMGTDDAKLRFLRREDGRTFWVPPTENLAQSIPEEDREVTGELRRAHAEVFLRNLEDDSEYLLPARTRVRLKVRESGLVRPLLQTSVPIAPTAAAGGGPLPPGRWEVQIAVTVAGFRRTIPVPRRGEPLVVTTYAPGRIVVGDAAPPPPRRRTRIYRRMPWPVVGSLKRARAVAARRG